MCREAAPSAHHRHRRGGQDGFTVVLRTDRGAQVHYGPFTPEGVEVVIMHLGSALALTAIRYQTVLRGADFGAALHQQALPNEAREKREEIAARLAEAMVRDGISRELYAICWATSDCRRAWASRTWRTSSRPQWRHSARGVLNRHLPPCGP
jgi:hypothetical protein